MRFSALPSARSASGVPVRRSSCSEALHREAPVGRRGQRKNGLGHLGVGVDRRAAVARTAEHHAVLRRQVGDLLVGVVGHRFGRHPQPVDQRPDARHLLRDGRVVPLDSHEVRHRASRDRLHLTGPPVQDPATRLRRLARRVVLQRHGDDVATHTEVGAGQLAEPAADGVEGVEVGARLEGWVDRRAERVHERMHVGGVQVVLLVPGRGREHDVGQQRGAGHPEVQRQQQVELALGWVLVTPGDVAGSAVGRRQVGHQVVVGSEQVLEEVLVALPRGAQQVRPPQREAARPVLRRVRILDRERERSVAQLVGDIGRHLLPGRRGVVGDVEGVAVELRVGRHPTQSRGQRDGVHGVHACEVAPRQRRRERIGPIAVVAPLVGVGVPVGRADHLARRTLPVGRPCHGGPPGHRTALLLAHVVRPAAPVAPHRPGEQQQREHRAVGGIAVEPLADPRPHDDHGAALRLLGSWPAISRAIRTTCAAGTEVIDSCHAGV